MTVSVRRHRGHTSLDRYPEPFEGTVRTPSVASDRGYCLQTAGQFARKPANSPGQDCDPMLVPSLAVQSASDIGE